MAALPVFVAGLPMDELTALSTIVYDTLHANDADAVYYQSDILGYDVIPEGKVVVLLDVTNYLVHERLFKPVTSQGEVGWVLRSKSEAKQYRSLTSEQEIVFSIIDEGGNEGAWTKTIKTRSNLHEAVYKAAIKHLESKNMVTDMKSVEHPTRKMYIKTSVRQSDKSTGGPWFTNGELDGEFIGQIAKVLYNHIKGKTFYHASASPGSPRMPKKVISNKRNMSPEEARALRAEVLDMPPYVVRQLAFQRYLPMPAGYDSYPTLNDLTQFVEASPITDQVLSQEEIQQLLDVLIFDDKIEAVTVGERTVYRALRHSLVDEEDMGSQLAEVPCGRCPVFDLCEEGGPVGPSNCEYFAAWLSL